MTRWTAWAAAAACLGGFLVGASAGAQTLAAIGADGGGVGRVLTPIAPAGAGVALGDGNFSYSGLAYSTADGFVYTVQNDSAAQSSLVSFDIAAPTALSAPVALGEGFTGGLAVDGQSGLMYAIASDPFGLSTLYEVGPGGATSVAALGVAFFGGLTWDASDGALYALGLGAASAFNGVYRIELGGGGASVTDVLDLGDGSIGFLGGLAWDAANARFLALGTDGDGNASLYDFTLGGAGTLNALQGVGTGFTNAALAFLPDAPAVPPTSPAPEPSALALLALGVLALVVRTRRFPSSAIPLAGALR